MAGCAVTLVQTDPSENTRVISLQKRIPPACDVTIVQRASDDFVTFIQALANHHARHASRRWPLFYISDTVTSPWIEKLPALAETLSAPFTLCYLHRWNDRCDFLTGIKPLGTDEWTSGYSLAQTRNAHGGDALLVSWRGVCDMLNDKVVRKTAERLKLATPFPPFDPSIPHTNSDTSFPSRDMLFDIKASPAGLVSTDPQTAPGDGRSPLDGYLCQLAKNVRTVTTVCITPCLFQWWTPHTSSLGDYEKTHECSRVVVETESRAFRAAKHAQARVREIPRAFEWVLILLLIVIGGVVWYKSTRRKNRVPT